MFCTKCGANLEDGAKFCTSCGAPTRFAQVPPPAAEAPAAPVAQPSAPVQPAAPERFAAQTPAAPAAPAQPATPAQPTAPAQPAAPAQPTQPMQSAWNTPAAPAAPAQPQPQQWQQPQQPQAQWQQPQQAQPQWQQPQQPQPQWQPQQAQPQWQPTQPQPTRQQPDYNGGGPAKPKKGKAGLIIGIAAAVVVIAAVLIGGFVWPGFFKGKGAADSDSGSGLSPAFVKKATPEELFQAVENNSVNDTAHHIATTYDNLFLSNATSKDISATGKLSLEPGDKLRELLTDALGEYLDQLNPGDDLGWLKSISASYEVSRKDDLLGLKLGVLINGSDIVHLEGTAQEGGDLILAVPELSDRAFAVPLEDLDFSSFNIASNAIVNAMLDSLEIEELDKDDLDLDAITAALPDADTVEELLTKYLNEAIDLVEDVERSEGTLSVAGVSAEYTVLTSTIDEDTMQAIVDKLGPELTEDKDIKKIIVGLADAAGLDGEDKYDEFTEKLDDKLQEIVDNMDHDLVITVYLDKKTSEVAGRIIDNGEQKLEMLMPEEGGEFGLMLRFTDVDGERLVLMGEGKRSGDKLTGDLDLQFDGEYYGVVSLRDFDVEKAKDGSFVGGVDLKPSASVWSLITDKADESGMEIPESIKSLLDTLELRLDLDTSKDKASISVTVVAGADKLFTLAVEGAKGSAKKITPAEAVDSSEWVNDITLDKLEKVVAAIEKAGVPTAYTDILDEALEDSFG